MTCKGSLCLIVLWATTAICLTGFILSIVRPWEMMEDDQLRRPRTESLREIRNTKSVNEKVDEIIDSLVDDDDFTIEKKEKTEADAKWKRKEKRRRKKKKIVDSKNENSSGTSDRDHDRLDKKRQKKKERLLRDQEEYRRWKKKQLKAQNENPDPVEELWEELFKKNLDFNAVFKVVEEEFNDDETA